MLKRTKYFISGLLIAITVGAIAQTSGLPSRPRFLSIGVGTAAPSTNGNVNVSGSVTASNFVGNIGGVAPSDFARQSQIPNFTGGQVIVTDSDPDFVLLESDTGTDEKRWHMRANANNWRLTLANDAGVDITNAITVARTGTTADSIELQATSVQVNGTEVSRVGTFTATFSFPNGSPPPTPDTATCRYSIVMHTVTLSCEEVDVGIGGTIGVVSITGAPAELTPTTKKYVPLPVVWQGTTYKPESLIRFDSNGSIIIETQSSNGLFSVFNGSLHIFPWTVTYNLN